MNSFFKPKSRKSDIFGRYYTDQRISYLIYELTYGKKNKRILDLGCGAGNLSIPYLLADELFDCTLIDIDMKLAKNILTRKNLNFYNFDLLVNNEKFHKVTCNKYDLAICNPPYIDCEWNDYLKSIIKDINFDLKILNKKYAPVPLVFLALNLKLLLDDGSLFIILPDQYINGLEYANLRKHLLQNYQLKKIIKLPSNSFQATQVESYILEIKKGLVTNNVEIYEIDNKFDLRKVFDTDYFSLKESFNFKKLIAINHKDKISISYLKDIFRGNISSNKLNFYDVNIFHSTNCGLSGKIPSDFIYKDPNFFIKNNIKYAEKGDIILCRIGRNFYKKIFFVRDGFIGVSDHFFIVKIDRKKSKKLYNWLIGIGNIRLQNLAQGSGAKFINIYSFKLLCFNGTNNWG